MEEFTELQLEEIENSIMMDIDYHLVYKSNSNKIDLLDMLIDSLEARREELSNG